MSGKAERGKSRHKVALIACGSFNPITNMHLRMFETARDSLQDTGSYEVIQGIISPTHDAYAKAGLVDASHRLEMCRLAVQTSDWITVDSWEVSQQGWTPTRRVLEHFRDSLNSSDAARESAKKSEDVAGENDEICVRLLCGGDLLESFAKPGLWKDEDLETILGKFGLVVIGRASSNPERFIYEHDIVYKHKRNVHLATEWFSNDISSTKVRNAVRRGESIKYVVQTRHPHFSEFCLSPFWKCMEPHCAKSDMLSVAHLVKQALWNALKRLYSDNLVRTIDFLVVWG